MRKTKLKEKTKLVEARPSPWEVTNSYLNKREYPYAAAFTGQLQFLRNIVSGVPTRQQLEVTINDITETYVLGGIGKGDDYFNTRGQSLYQQLEFNAALGHSKVSIH